MEKKVAVKIPMVPNFIKVGDKPTSIEKFTDDELKEIGKEWTIKLIETAKKRRATPF
jgi:hypothetical protein